MDFRDEIHAVVKQIRIAGSLDTDLVRQIAAKTMDEMFSPMKAPSAPNLPRQRIPKLLQKFRICSSLIGFRSKMLRHYHSLWQYEWRARFWQLADGCFDFEDALQHFVNDRFLGWTVRVDAASIHNNDMRCKQRG